MEVLNLHSTGDREGGDRYYTGVGARITPSGVCKEMTEIAKVLNKLGYTLRSGAAREGADEAFRVGSGGKCQLFDPHERNYKTIEHAYGIAERHHPYWDNLSPFVKKLMARNVHACLGPDLLVPSNFLICWTIDGMNCRKERTRQSGGTGHTVCVAGEFRIPCYNLNKPSDYEFVMENLMRGNE